MAFHQTRTGDGWRWADRSRKLEVDNETAVVFRSNRRPSVGHGWAERTLEQAIQNSHPPYAAL
jgi:hypothetical protein